MSEQELFERCRAPKLNNVEFSDYYGLGYLLKKYAGVPDFVPLYFHCDHGPALEENVLDYELKSTYTKALFHNRLKVKDALEKKFTEAFVTGAPFVYHRRSMGISRSAEVSGTVCFPIHSTYDIDPVLDWDDYILSLKQLPPEMHPVTVCLHHVDVTKGLHRRFMDQGLQVTSAGHKWDRNFVVNFYEIIRDKKFATSNAYGSYVPYCVEFGLPFFFFGEQEIKMKNRGNSSIKPGLSNYQEYIDHNRQMTKYYEAKELFSSINLEVTEAQRRFADEVLGLSDAISVEKLNKIIWNEALKNLPEILSSRLVRDSKKLIKNVKKSLKHVKIII